MTEKGTTKQMDVQVMEVKRSDWRNEADDDDDDDEFEGQ